MKLRRAAFFHDIGKIAVSRSTLAKPGALDDDEWERDPHPPGGRAPRCSCTRDCPTRPSGSASTTSAWTARGYPNGCAGDEIDLEARIIFVADAFEAMTSDRPYREGMEVDEAVAELRECAGSQFDGRVVDALVALLERDALTVLALRAA